MSSFFVYERVCPVCGKTFIIAPYHVYSLNINGRKVDYCSYSCFRKIQKEREEKKIRKRKF